MALNKFLEFNEQKNEMQTDEQYSADIQRIGGLQTGLARTVLHNKLFRQASVMVSALGKVVADLGKNADDTSRDTLAQNIKDTILPAENHTLSTETAGMYGVGNVDGALALLGNAKWYGKYIKLSLASGTSAGDIAFSTKENDDFNITNLTTYPTRLFVPSGAKKVRISANIQATCYPNKHFKVSLYKNTTKVKDFLARESTQGSGETDTKHNSEIFDVVDGDYFKLNVTDNTNVMFSNCTFTLEVIN